MDDDQFEQTIDDALEEALGRIDAELGLEGVTVPDGEGDEEVRATLLGLLRSYLEAHDLLPEPGERLKIDAAFLSDHGAPLLLHMMEGFFAAMTTLDDEEEGGESDEPSGSPDGVKVDLSALLAAFLGESDPEPEG